MCFLSFTTLARSARKRSRKRTERPPRAQVVLTWFLSGVWVALMTFGVISQVNPEWLQELSRPGIESECRSYKRYGDAALRQHNYNLAAGQYVKALRLRPEDASVHLNLGITYLRAGNPAEGAKFLGKALQFQPGPSLQAAAYYNLGEMYEQQGKPVQATRCFQKAIELQADPVPAYHKLAAQHFATQQFAQAHDALEKKLAAQLDPTQPYRQMLLRGVDEYAEDPIHLPIIEQLAAQGACPDDLERYDFELFRQMRQTDPDVSRTYTLLGRVCAQLDDFGPARQHFQKSLEIWPDNPDARNDLARLEGLRRDQP